MKYNKKLYPAWYVGGFGGAFDCLGSGLQTFSLFFVPPSIYSIAKNATVVFTAFFSVVYLKKRLFRHQILAILVIMLGFILVAISNILFDNENPHNHTFNFMSIIGIISLFISLIFQGFCYCYEEKLFDEYDLNVAHLLGFESMMGAVVSSFLFFITMNFKCTHPEFCNSEVGQVIDSPANAIYDLHENKAWLYFILTMFSIMIFNLVGVFITKYSGAVLRVILDTLRTILVWIISIFMGFETLKPFTKIFLELTGFFFLILGNLIFNELLVFKFCSLDKNTKKNREAREKQQQKEQENLNSKLIDE